MNKTKLRKIIKEEMQRYLKEFDIPRTPEEEDKPLGELPKGYGSTGLDPEETEPSTLGLEEAEASHAFGIGMEIVEDWRPWASSPGAITKAWQSLFEALDELPNGVTIAKQLKEISNDYLERYEKQQDER